MNDQQLKIRIKLNQIPHPLNAEHPEGTVAGSPSVFEKPPFDWRKIAVAVLLFLSILVGILYGSSAENNDEAITEYFPTEGIHSSHIDKRPSPDEKTESGDSTSVDNKETASDSSGNTTEMSSAVKPAISAAPSSKPGTETTPPPNGIIPLRKPQLAR